MNLNERQRKLLKRTFLDYQQTAEFLKNPLIVQRAEGLYYWDVEGKRYFDGIGGGLCVRVGGPTFHHKNQGVEDAEISSVGFIDVLGTVGHVGGVPGGREGLKR